MKQTMTNKQTAIEGALTLDLDPQASDLNRKESNRLSSILKNSFKHSIEADQDLNERARGKTKRQ